MDTVKNIKMGEFAPGIVTPKKKTFTGSEFLNNWCSNIQTDFEETSISFDGIPSKIINTDSILLDNTKWYCALTKSEYHVNYFTYTYHYYGQFTDRGVMINFYSQKLNKKAVKAKS